MAVYRRTNRTRSVFVVLVLTAVTLLTLDARANGSGFLGTMRGDFRDAWSHVQSGTHAALRPIGNFFSGIVDYGSLRSENERLRQELAATAAGSVAATAELKQAQQLLATEHLPFVGSIPTVAAQVIDQGSSNFETTVTINKGSDDGLVSGQPVVTGGGLVGSIGEVAHHTATVQLLTDPDFIVGVRLDPANVGSAQGVGAGSPLRVTVVTTSQAPPRLTRGQAVVTSGLSLERFPPGIPVGTVSSVTTTPGAVEPTITLNPIVNLNQLDFVQVELWSRQTPP